MSAERIHFLLQFGNVQNPKTYFRAKIHRDQNEKSRIASICGCHPENGHVIVKLPNNIPGELLDMVIMPLTESTYADLQSQGKVQEFPEGNFKWILVPLSAVAGGKITEEIVPLLDSEPNLSGDIQFSIESDADGQALKSFKEQDKSAVYAYLKSFRVLLTANLNQDQVNAGAHLITTVTGADAKKYSSICSKFLVT